MSLTTPLLRKPAQERMRFIEFRLFWEGRINRADVKKQFAISAPQASLDFNDYKEIAPNNLDYDLRKKHYQASANFSPSLWTPSPEGYLSQLKAMHEGTISEDDAWIAQPPAMDMLPTLHRRVDVNILQKLVRAITHQRSLAVSYQSLHEECPDLAWRHITPHAFFYDGMRWHVRAFCHRSGRFKDFVLSRFVQVGDEGVPAARGEDDVEWQSYVELTLIPNPALSEAQRAIVADDYGMQNGELRIRLRQAALFYFKKRHRLDSVTPAHNPQEIPLVMKEEENI